MFRLVIQIPAAVFLQIVQYGLTVPLILVTWVIVLFQRSDADVALSPLCRPGALLASAVLL